MAPMECRNITGDARIAKDDALGGSRSGEILFYCRALSHQRSPLMALGLFVWGCGDPAKSNSEAEQR